MNHSSFPAEGADPPGANAAPRIDPLHIGPEKWDGALWRSLLAGVGFGVAVADADTLTILFENERFSEWFGPEPSSGVALPARVPAIEIKELDSELERARTYETETETGSGARAVSLRIQVRRCALGEREYVIAECHDMTAQKKAESMLDSYSRMAEQNARDVRGEKERAERLLRAQMPLAVYQELKEFGSVTPRRFDEATVVMLDIVGFADMAVQRDPGALVSELNDIFSAFDRIVDLFNCERIKTVGDGYMAVAGVPEASPDHAACIARVALRMRRYLEQRNTPEREPWLCRIGIHSGPVVGSIVGVQKYAYDIFGPGVNLAARMESMSKPMQITMTQEAFDLIRKEFVCSELGAFEVKSFGTRTLYALDAEVEPR